MAAECDVEAGRLENARASGIKSDRELVGSTVADPAVTNYNSTAYDAAWVDAAAARKAVRFEKTGACHGSAIDSLIKRWGVLPATLNSYVTKEAQTIANFGDKANTFQSHVDMFIPLNAIDLSTGTLTQNAGY